MTTDTAPPPPPPSQPNGNDSPPPTGPASPRASRLTRRYEDKHVGGVAGGLADHFGLDPLLVRIAFGLFAFSGGGILLYLVLWVVLPERGTGEVIADNRGKLAEHVRSLSGDRGWQFWLGALLITIAVINILDGVFYFDGDVLWALVLIGAGILLFRHDRERTEQGSLPDAVVAPGLDDAWEPTALPATPTQPLADVVPPVTPARLRAPRPPRVKRERSILGRLTLGLAVLWAGIAFLLDEAFRGIDFTAAGIAGVAMAILGGGLLLGAFYGRARWLILVALLLTPLVMVSAALDQVDVPVSAGMGSRYLVVDSGQPTVDLELFAGQVEINVTDYGRGTVDADAGDRFVEVTMGAGELVVAVPHDWTIELDAHVDGGEITVFDWGLRGDGVFQDGFDQRVTRTFEGAAGRPTVHLDLDVGFGVIRIEPIQYATEEEIEDPTFQPQGRIEITS